MKGFVKVSQGSQQDRMWSIASYSAFSSDQLHSFLGCESGLTIKWQEQGYIEAGPVTVGQAIPITICRECHPSGPVAFKGALLHFVSFVHGT